MSRRFPFLSSDMLTIVGGIVAALAAIPAPWPAISLDTGLGRVLYVGAIFLLGVGFLAARRAENAKAEQAQQARDAAEQKRHDEAISSMAGQFAAVIRAMGRLQDAVVSLAASVPSSQRIELSAAVATAAATLAEIRENPPQTPDAVQAATQKVEAGVNAIVRATILFGATAHGTATAYPGGLSMGEPPTTKPTLP